MMAKSYVTVVDGRVEVLAESDLRDMETSGIKGVITSQIGTMLQLALLSASSGPAYLRRDLLVTLKPRKLLKNCPQNSF